MQHHHHFPHYNALLGVYKHAHIQLELKHHPTKAPPNSVVRLLSIRLRHLKSLEQFSLLLEDWSMGTGQDPVTLQLTLSWDLWMFTRTNLIHTWTRNCEKEQGWAGTTPTYLGVERDFKAWGINNKVMT